MLVLKTILITSYEAGELQYELDKIINTVRNASIQYRTSNTSGGSIYHSALIIHEVPDELEGDEDND